MGPRGRLHIPGGALAAALGALGLLCAPSADAAFPGDDGRIVQVGLLSGSGGERIFSREEDGSGVTPLTADDGAAYSQPAYSPDGTRIAYARDGDIWAMRADGAEKTRLTTDGEGDEPAWSADGSEVFFATTIEGDSRIYKIAATGPQDSEVPAIGAGIFDSAPAVSPDGETLLFRTFDGGSQSDLLTIPVVNEGCVISGCSPFATTGSDEDHGNWAPGGASIVFDNDPGGEQNIYVDSFPPTGAMQLTTAGEETNPAFSPDGARVVYQSGSGEVRIMDADGENDATLASAGVESAREPDWGVYATLPSGGGSESGGGSGSDSGPKILLAPFEIFLGADGAGPATSASLKKGLIRLGGGVWALGVSTGGACRLTLQERPTAIRFGRAAAASGAKRKKRRAGLLKKVKLDAPRAGLHAIPLRLTAKGRRLVRRRAHRRRRGKGARRALASGAAVAARDPVTVSCQPVAYPQASWGGGTITGIGRASGGSAGAATAPPVPTPAPPVVKSTAVPVKPPPKRVPDVDLKGKSEIGSEMRLSVKNGKVTFLDATVQQRCSNGATRPFHVSIVKDIPIQNGSSLGFVQTQPYYLTISGTAAADSAQLRVASGETLPGLVSCGDVVGEGFFRLHR
jgi:WD40-like Beta Propeller Repeat